MAEHVLVRQNDRFEIEFLVRDSDGSENGEFEPVQSIHELDPYTMLLSSLGACTAIVLHTYAQNHDVDLKEVELELQYKRVFQEDCENCEDIDRYDEKIHESLKILGDLEEAERKKLFHIAHQCSVHKMLEAGIEIESDLAANGGEE